MKWSIGGPDLPEELLQLLEDGHLVLFCGAGVSYPAGLPDFKGLVEKVFELKKLAKSDFEQAEFKQQNFDRVLGLLEGRLGQESVRKAVVDSLQLDPSKNLATHRSLLTLATNREGVCHLVTTNFDRGFEFAASNSVAIDTSPRLSVPKPKLWNSIVHLHGRICDADPDGKSLVMTSADFGAAYLTERWASRFLSELFRRFAVLFVGYSIEDPVVRYMMDAFAADRASGEDVGEGFVMAGCDLGNEKKQAEAWKAKGVTPLLYDCKDNHAALHETLSRWADCHRRGLLGKENIIQEHGSKSPTKPYKQDPVVSQVIWALSEESGHVANVFARLDPVASVEWLEVFEEVRLLFLPCTLMHTDDAEGWRVPLADGGERTALAPTLNRIGVGLAEWLTRHLNKQEVLDWALRKGGVLHPIFRWIVRKRLTEDSHIPSALRTLWTVLASEIPLVRTNGHHSTFQLQNALASGRWDLQLRRAVTDSLSPVLELRPPISRVMFPNLEKNDDRIADFAEAAVVPLYKDSVRLLLEGINNSPSKQKILSDLADDATDLLKRAMNLFEMMQKADPFWDWSYSDQPSIAPHPQNSNLRDWTLFIEFCRDTWIALLQVDPPHARRIVERWKTLRYPAFRRLCFFAMANSELYAAKDCLDYLLEEDSRWLWSLFVNREKFRLVDSIWPKLDEADAAELVAQILSGPPRSMFRGEIGEEDFAELAEREVWLQLSKLQRTGTTLPGLGQARLLELGARYPEWRLDDENRNEFTTWMTQGFGEVPVENLEEFVVLSDDDVIARLSASELKSGDLERWRHLISSNPVRALSLLNSLATESIWKSTIWSVALEAIGSQKGSAQLFPSLELLHKKAPGPILRDISAPLAWCLKEAAESPVVECQRIFLALWDSLQPYIFANTPEVVSDPITMALNTPSGYLTQALLNYVGNKEPQHGSDLEAEVWQRLTLLAEGNGPGYKLARVLLASRFAWFHRLSPAWAEERLLPFFNWSQSPEAPEVWDGFLWQARVTPELWPKIKNQFLATLTERHRLRNAEERVCELLGAICIDMPDWLTAEETREALRCLDSKGRSAVARIVWKRLEGADAQSGELWRDLVGPWLDSVWPKDLAMRDFRTSFNLAMAVSYAGWSFKPAVELVAPLIVGAQHCSLLWQQLLQAKLPGLEPQATLKLAGAIVDPEQGHPDFNLRNVLDEIQLADPAAAEQKTFTKLNEYLRKYGL